jgi:hypothetical protein
MKTSSRSNSVKSMKNQKSPTKPDSNSHANSKERPPLSKDNNDANVVPNTDDIIATEVNTNPEMNQPNDSIEVDNTTNSTTSESKDSIEPPPLTYPFIKESDDSIKIFIYNTDAGKEGDLIHFYDNSYWELVGLHPDIEVSNDTVKHRDDIAPATQTGGNNENVNKDELDGPYGFFERFVTSIFKPTQQPNTKPEPPPITEAKPEPPPITEENKETTPDDKSNTLLSISPVPVSSASPVEQGDDNQKGSSIASSISNLFSAPDIKESGMNNDPNIIVLTFFPNQGIKPYKEVIETRNQETDIDITQTRYKFKELEKIKMIKDTKKLSVEVSIEEVFYINGKLVVLKGMLNTFSNDTAGVIPQNILIDVDTELSMFPNTRGYTSE